MKITLVSIGGKAKSGACESLVGEYVGRCVRYSAVEAKVFATEEKFLGWVEGLRRRGLVRVVLFDPAGKLVSSEALAGVLREAGVAGVQQLVFAVGPADGWRAAVLPGGEGVERVSFGRITLPHELALVVAAEQVYRGLTILAGHPYHGGH